MTPRLLVLRGLTYYWRTNVAVVLGVATAVAVLAGALIVGESVRGSLRDLVLQRLGAADQVVVSTGFFSERLAGAVASHPDFDAVFEGAAPIVIAQGLVTEESGGRRSNRVDVYGVDDRFWRFHGVSGRTGPDLRDAFLSPALARELAAEAGGAVLVRVQRPSQIPIESLFGDKDDLGRSLRLTVRAVVPAAELGEFSLRPRQGDVRAVFVSLARLQQDLEIEGRVNALLVAARPERAAGSAGALSRLVREEAGLEDEGLRLRALDVRSALSVESDGGLLTDPQVKAAERAAADSGLASTPVFAYLANGLRVRDREVPYSLVAAIDFAAIRLTPAGSLPRLDPAGIPPPIVLNEWAARDLNASPGDPLVLDYYLWEDSGRLVTRSETFQVAAIVPIAGVDRDLAPSYPGISDAPTLDEWDPPFPIDLRRVRPADEEYWRLYRTTPKAYVSIEAGRALWRSRHGGTTSVQVTVTPGQPLDEARDAYGERLAAAVASLAAGLAVRDVRAEGLEASRGATDFGEYFVYFSFFLVVSALLLAALFFKLSVEQRAREVGLLRALGASTALVRRLFLAEGLVLAGVGSALGLLGAIAYGELMMTGLRTWWVDAVGTTALRLHPSAGSLAAGAAGGVVAAAACIRATLGGLGALSERTLLAGQLAPDVGRAQPGSRRDRRHLTGGLGCAAIGIGLIAATAVGLVGSTVAFFGAGAALLAAALSLVAFRLRRPSRDTLTGQGWAPVVQLGARNTTYRPGRSVLAMTVMASATFMLISVDAFRREGGVEVADRRSGVGGYGLLVDLLLPVVHDPNARDARVDLGLDALDEVRFEPFRVLPGDDASCLNLYQPSNPRILAPRDSFIAEGRFRFKGSLASTDAERDNPWLLLAREEPDGAVPVIADTNSMTYVLHRALGEDLEMSNGGETIRLRLVAALDDSIFQGEILMSQANFLKLFPDQAGSRFLLVDAPVDRLTAVSTAIEEALADLGADATPAADRLAEFHRVENTYLSTFQTLGGLGLMLGTLGLGAVLLRNVFERRRELALLRALGYRRAHLVTLVVAENATLLGAGLLAGTVCALLAIAPVVWDRGGQLPFASLALLVGSVLAVGLLASVGATAVALRAPLIPSLRSE